MRELEIARQAAAEAGQVIRRYFREGFQVQAKAESNLVSDADLAAEQAIVGRIRQAFPEHEILGEEAHPGNAAASHLWIIDPIDGTNNFVHRLPHFAVSIAYYRDSQPVCGVVHQPLSDDWYVASRGDGARHNGHRVQVTAAHRLEEVLVGVGFYYDRGAMMEATLASIRDLFRQRIHGIRRFGSAALDLCYVGTGRFGAFFEYELSPWDFAAARLFVEEAGGQVTTCQGQPLPLTKCSLLATNGALHADVLAIVGRNWHQ